MNEMYKNNQNFFSTGSALPLYLSASLHEQGHTILKSSVATILYTPRSQESPNRSEDET